MTINKANTKELVCKYQRIGIS